MYKLLCFSVISCITKSTAHELAKAQDPYPLTYQKIPLFRKQCSLRLNHRLLPIPIPGSSNEFFQNGLLFKYSLVRLSCKLFKMFLLSVSTSLTLSVNFYSSKSNAFSDMVSFIDASLVFLFNEFSGTFFTFMLYFLFSLDHQPRVLPMSRKTTAYLTIPYKILLSYMVYWSE